MSEEALSNRTEEHTERRSEAEHRAFQQRQKIIEYERPAYNVVITKTIQLVWLLFGALEALIGLRVVLKFVAANPAAPFASLVYQASELFLWPFNGLVQNPSLNGMVLEISSIIAMLVYALVAWILASLIGLLISSRKSRAIKTYEEEDRIN